MFQAYAKINLGLRVMERRPDGYHNIVTVFHRIALHDDIAFAPLSEISVRSSSADVPSDESNICYRAASLLHRELRPQTGVCIELLKRIPVGAGLGGGSSDAATVLLHLPAFWGQTVEERFLRVLALQLGSDVPFFLGTGSARATGRGEHLEYFSLDIPYWILVCYPNIHVSTSWAYANVKPAMRPVESDLNDILCKQIDNPDALREVLVNDFEPVVFAAYPVVREVKQMMLDGGAVFASMSGSGSAVYGFFRDVDRVHVVERGLATRGYATHRTPPHFRVQVP